MTDESDSERLERLARLERLRTKGWVKAQNLRQRKPVCEDALALGVGEYFICAAHWRDMARVKARSVRWATGRAFQVRLVDYKTAECIRIS